MALGAAIAERPEVVIDFGEAALGCVFELRNNAPVPFAGVFPSNVTDSAPLPELLRFKVARTADGSRDASAGWERAGGVCAPRSAAQRRAVVDAALMLQAGGTEGLRTNMLLAAVDAAEPRVPPSPAVVHAPASPQLAAALSGLDALPLCASHASEANAESQLHPSQSLCLRRLTLFEQMACPSALPSPGDGIPPLPLAGPLAGQATYGPVGVTCAAPDAAGRCPNTREVFQSSAFANCTLPMTPLRVLLGTASVGADGRVTPFIPPSGFEDPPTEYVGMRADPVTGQLVRQEIWDWFGAPRLPALRCT